VKQCITCGEDTPFVLVPAPLLAYLPFKFDGRSESEEPVSDPDPELRLPW